jgi:cysteine desulfurase / selenocysteine lyase
LTEWILQDVQVYRDLIPITAKYAYLNNSESSPNSLPVIKAVQEFLKEDLQAVQTFKHLEEQCPRSVVSSLLGCREGEIVYMPSTAFGINTAANMVNCKPGSNVVIDELSFPNNMYVGLKLKERGVELRRIPVTIGGKGTYEKMEKFIDDNTAAVIIDHVSWINGYKYDLRVLADMVHRHGGYLIVDATQSAGAMKINFSQFDIDFLACATYKYLMGPAGAGFLCIREDLQSKVDPYILGWWGMQHSGHPDYIFNTEKLDFRNDVKRFQTGVLSVLSFVAAGAGLGILASAGIESIEDRVLAITGRLIEKVDTIGVKINGPVEDQNRGGIVHLAVNNPVNVCEKLRDRNVIVAPRGLVNLRGIRVSPHFYNTDEEIDKLVDGLRIELLA